MTKRIFTFMSYVVMGIVSLMYFIEMSGLRKEERMVVDFLLLIFAALLIFELVLFFKQGNLSDMINISYESILGIIKTPQFKFIISIILFVFTFPLIGFFTASFLYILVYNLLIGNKKVKELIIVESATLIFAYLLFIVIFGVDLPKGIFF